jgi:hypothetical protein
MTEPADAARPEGSPAEVAPTDAVPAGAAPAGSGPAGAGPTDALSFDMVTAALRADSADVTVYARVLTESLGGALPPDCVTVERARSMSDRVRGRPGEVSKITVRLGEQVLGLQVQSGRPTAEICREVRGVVLSRQPVAVHQWVDELARALVEHAQQNAHAAEALRKLVAGP